MITGQQAFDMFLEESDRIWGEEIDGVVFFWTVVDTEEYVAALAAPRKVTATGTDIKNVAPQYTLLLTDMLLAMRPSEARAVMAHEAIHIGHQNHGKQFVRLAKRYGAVYDEISTFKGNKKCCGC